MKTHTLFIAFAAIMLVMVVNGCASKGPHRCYLGMFHGRIYDVDTDEPIEGAVVHVTYTKYGSTSAGAIGVNVAVRETLTNAKGEYLIPEDTMMHECYSGKLQGDIQIFKPGYGYIGKAKLSCPDQEKEVVYSSHGEAICITREGKYLIWGLPKLKTRKERLDNLRSISLAIDIPHDQQMKLLKSKSEERVSLGLPPLSETIKGN